MIPFTLLSLFSSTLVSYRIISFVHMCNIKIIVIMVLLSTDVLRFLYYNETSLVVEDCGIDDHVCGYSDRFSFSL